ncbi:hypothetical protein HY632_01185 [Candidatus Uhrbacteria bacterium]|nr:hypothetical protein [Candidatus Uhrbacteria bacterium]
MVRKIRLGAEHWTAEHIPPGETFTRDRVAELLRHLEMNFGETIRRMTKDFPDREKYPALPAVKLLEGCDGKYPDIWMLGWRGEEGEVDGTDIHDHMDSEVAILVHEGDVQEEVLAFDAEEWKQGAASMSFHRAERTLKEGSLLTIGAPYLHLVRGRPGQRLAVTIHGYYPPLDAMQWFEIRGGQLVKGGEWHENRGCQGGA